MTAPTGSSQPYYGSPPAPAPTMPSGQVPGQVEVEQEHGAQRTIALIVRALGYLIYFYLLVVEIVLVLAFFLLLFGANPTSGFVEWVYRSADRAMEPFRGIFPTIELGTTSQEVEAVFEPSIVFAMVIYGIVAVALHAFIMWLGDRIRRIDADNRLRQQRADYEAAQYRAYVAQYQVQQQAAAARQPQPQPQPAPQAAAHPGTPSAAQQPGGGPPPSN